jgi:LacI family gluconate utilization system Gnt-I transcriptional repressor
MTEKCAIGEGESPEDSGTRPRAVGQRATIRDVARLSGVSRMTVSRAISEPQRVSADARQRVAKAIADLGYVPDRAAGSLSTRKTGFIALIVPTLTNSNFSTVAHGLTEVLREHGYQLLLAYTDYDLAEEERQLSNLLARRPEAIVLTGSTHSRAASRLLLSANVPIVEISDLGSKPIGHAVGFSNYQVGRTAARYLISKGFTQIGAIASKSEGGAGDYRGEDRIRGFEEELRFCGLSTDLILRHGQAPVSFEHGAAAIGALLDKAIEIEAVFAVSDLSAVGVVMECQRRGIDIPRDLSFMGFGDFEIGREINPPLTTIHVDFKALGQRTANLLLDQLNGTQGDDVRIIDVGLRLVERASVQGVK